MKKFSLLIIICSFFTLFNFSNQQILASSYDTSSVVQIKIYNKLTSQVVSWGSGVGLSPMEILTNYHVVKDVINHPDLYGAMVCVSNNIDEAANCSYLASPYGLLGKDAPRYNENLDLAIITYTEKITSTGTKNYWYWTYDDFPKITNISISKFGTDISLLNLSYNSDVQTLGYPSDNNGNFSYSSGNITGYDFNKYNDLLRVRISAKIYFGSSGGGAFDKNGDFLGITSGGWTDAQGNFIEGYIIPVTTVNWWLNVENGYRVNKDGEYTIIDESLEDTITKALELLGDGTQDPSQNSSESSICPENSHEEEPGICVFDSALGIPTLDPICKAKFGENGEAVTQFSESETGGFRFICKCKDGFTLNDEGICQNSSSITNYLDTNIDTILSKRLSGLILLQVEANGEAYYVYPNNKSKYYLGRPADAFNVMRTLGLGAKHDYITGHTTFPTEVLGKILLDVEKNGEAYYIYPKDRKAYYLGRPADAFRIMRELGLGITNSDLNKIPEGNL